ncbi:Golgi transport complex subunit 3 [Nowakowskiella sp. JEL0078]|nr:Golgi transport complex subunit 3 [Nowakowskiella sp. JEL0078]
MLREQIIPFDLSFVRKEEALNFQEMIDALSTVLSPTKWGLGSLSSISRGIISATRPRVIHSFTDSKLAVDGELKRICEDFILETAKACVEPVSSFMMKVSAFRISKEVGKEARTPLLSESLSKQSFGNPTNMLQVASTFKETVQTRLLYALNKMTDYLGDKKTEGVLIRVIQNNIVETYRVFLELVNEEYESMLCESLPTSSEIEQIIVGIGHEVLDVLKYPITITMSKTPENLDLINDHELLKESAVEIQKASDGEDALKNLQETTTNVDGYPNSMVSQEENQYPDLIELNHMKVSQELIVEESIEKYTKENQNQDFKITNILGDTFIEPEEIIEAENVDIQNSKKNFFEISEDHAATKLQANWKGYKIRRQKIKDNITKEFEELPANELVTNPGVNLTTNLELAAAPFLLVDSEPGVLKFTKTNTTEGYSKQLNVDVVFENDSKNLSSMIHEKHSTPNEDLKMPQNDSNLELHRRDNEYEYNESRATFKTWFNKRYMGGYRSTKKFVEYFHASTQTTTPHEIKSMRAAPKFHRDTQTKFIRNRKSQGKRDSFTQMVISFSYITTE